MESLPPPRPLTLSPSNSLRRRRSSLDGAPPGSPEFEFWMVGRNNPSNVPASTLLSADELFSGGIILPLRLLSASNTTSPSDFHPVFDSRPDPEHTNPQSGSCPHPPDPDPEPGHVHTPDPEPSASILSAPAEARAATSSSKRWKDIFKKSSGDPLKPSPPTIATPVQDKTTTDKEIKRKEKKRDRRNGNGGSGSAAELNINLWPFSRSRSAGNNAASGRPRPSSSTAGRKVSSAPCSRSNSAGESKSRKWPSSPVRAISGGVHLGRSSPVWQIRRNGSGRGADKSVKKDNNNNNNNNNNNTAAAESNVSSSRREKPSKGSGGGGGGSGKKRVLNLNVPMCIGYRQQLSCRREEGFFDAGGGEGGGGVEGGSGGSGGGGSRGTVGLGSGNNNTTSSVGGGGNLFNLRSFFTKKVH